MWDETYENCIETDRKLKEIMTMSACTSNGNNSNSEGEVEEAGDAEMESQGSEKELEIDLGMLDEGPEEPGLRLTPNKLQEKEKNLSAQFDALKNSSETERDVVLTSTPIKVQKLEESQKSNDEDPTFPGKLII